MPEIDARPSVPKGTNVLPNVGPEERLRRAKSITIKLAILFEVDSRQRCNVVHPTTDIGYYFENINDGDASSIVSA